MTFHANLEIARRADRAEIEFCAVAGRQEMPDLAEVRAGGGVALCGRPGSPLNKVLGLGLDGPVTDADLAAIEALYATRGQPAQIELCPLSFSDLPARLVARGFVPQGFENELGRALDARSAVPPSNPGVRVARATDGDDDAWLHAVAEGFVAAEAHVGGGPHADAPPIEALLEMMSSFQHPEIRRYLAWIDGEPVGGGAAWAKDGVLGIFGCGTRPAGRRRGVQIALVEAMLREAGPGIDLAVATTLPASTSQRNFERLGFRVLYTRAIFVKPAPAG